MRLELGIAISALVVATSCSTARPNPFGKTELGAKRVELYQRKYQEDLFASLERDRSFSNLLGNAAFEMTRGMNAERAIKNL